MSKGIDNLESLAENAKSAVEVKVSAEVAEAPKSKGVSADIMDKLNKRADSASTFEFKSGSAEVRATLTEENDVGEKLDTLESIAAKTQTTGSAATIPQKVLKAEEQLLAAYEANKDETDVRRWDKKMERAGFPLEPLVLYHETLWDIGQPNSDSYMCGYALEDYMIIIPTPACLRSPTEFCKSSFKGTNIQEKDVDGKRYIKSFCMAKKHGANWKNLWKGQFGSRDELVDNAPVAEPVVSETDLGVIDNKQPTPPNIRKFPQTVTIDNGAVYDPTTGETYKPMSEALQDEYKIHPKVYSAFKCVEALQEATEAGVTDADVVACGFEEGIKQITAFKGIEGLVATKLGLDMLKVKDCGLSLVAALTGTGDDVNLGGIRTTIQQSISQATGAVADVVKSGKNVINDVTGKGVKQTYEEIMGAIPYDIAEFSKLLDERLHPMYPSHVMSHKSADSVSTMTQYVNGNALNKETKGKATGRIGSPIGVRWKLSTEINPDMISARKIANTLNARMGIITSVAKDGMMVITALQTDSPGNDDDINSFLNCATSIYPELLILMELASTNSGSALPFLEKMDNVIDVTAFKDPTQVTARYFVFVGNEAGETVAKQLEKGYPSVWASMVEEDEDGSDDGKDTPPDDSDSYEMDGKPAPKNAPLSGTKNTRAQARGAVNSVIQGNRSYNDVEYDEEVEKGADIARTAGQMGIFLLMFIPKLIWNIVSFPFRMMFDRNRYGGYNSGGMWNNNNNSMYNRNRNHRMFGMNNMNNTSGMFGRNNMNNNGMFGRNNIHNNNTRNSFFGNNNRRY